MWLIFLSVSTFPRVISGAKRRQRQSHCRQASRSVNETVISFWRKRKKRREENRRSDPWLPGIREGTRMVGHLHANYLVRVWPELIRRVKLKLNYVWSRGKREVRRSIKNCSADIQNGRGTTLADTLLSFIRVFLILSQRFHCIPPFNIYVSNTRPFFQ